MSLVVLLLSAVILAATAIQSSALAIWRLPQQRATVFVLLHHNLINDDSQIMSRGRDETTNEHNSHVSHRRKVVSSLLSHSLFGVALPIWTITATSIPLSSSSSSNYAHAAIRDAKTGILLPSVGEIESAIPTTWDDDDNVLSSSTKSSFSRLDSSPDTIFYSEPRFVEHVDEQAVESMTSYISDRLLQPGDAVLDLCSSWTSHIRQQPKEGKSSLSLKRVAGLGMNAKELESNPTLTDWTVLDLNADANVKMPYEDESFDVVLLQLSIDYLIHPLEVLKEASRVLRKHGRIAILFSNRLFLTKAVGLWTGSDDIEHAYTVGNYLHYCDGGFTNIKAEDLSTRKQKGKERVIVGDPLYVVIATKG
jgi:SAM-dependent methyltransferase